MPRNGLVPSGAALGSRQPSRRNHLKPAASAGLLIAGNFQSYAVSPWTAYTGMWGVNLPQNNTLVASSSMRVVPSSFPNATQFSWDVTPDPDWGGVNGYLHVAYGNYDWSPGAFTSRRALAVANLTFSQQWTFTGDPASGLLCECWLTTTPHTAGTELTDKTHEVGFFPKVSADGQAFLGASTTVGPGSFVDSNGVTWNVRENVGGTALPYFMAYRNSYADHTGALPFQDLFRFLVDNSKITGNEYVNGVAWGVEPRSGTGTLTADSLSVTYTAGSSVTNLITNGGFASATGWSGAGFSGKSISGGKANFAASPTFDGFTQSSLTFTTGKYYELKYTVSGYTSGSLFAQLAGGTPRNASSRTANGTYTERLQANTGNNALVLMLNTAGTLSVDDVSLIGPYDTSTIGGA